jgi:lysozyme family protein
MTDYSPAFLAQIPKTLAFEGGYVNDPQDPGGETNFGISKRSYPDLDIARLTVEQATMIYWQDFWLRGRVDLLTNSQAAGKLFDMGVNMGSNRAVRILQTELNRNAWAGLTVDGRAGPLTLASANKAPDAGLVYWLRLGSEAFYNDLAMEHPVMRKYLRGWLRRAAA